MCSVKVSCPYFFPFKEENSSLSGSSWHYPLSHSNVSKNYVVYLAAGGQVAHLEGQDGHSHHHWWEGNRGTLAVHGLQEHLR